MQEEDKLFYHIARSHLYWGRKPTAGLTDIFEITNLGSKSVFLDPFCGGGTSVICALIKGAKVLASDINPMAIFLTKVLIKPVSLLALQDAFKLVRDKVKLPGESFTSSPYFLNNSILVSSKFLIIDFVFSYSFIN